MGVVIVYSVGGADVAETEDVVVGAVEFEVEAVGGELPYNLKTPTPAATATAPAPAYFRKRRLDVFRGDSLDSTKALNHACQVMHERRGNFKPMLSISLVFPKF
jgi:hypothetical protein